MAEWLIAHAWKSDRFTRADAYEIPPTHSRSTTSRNIDTRRHVLVNHRVDGLVTGVCDTVVTQFPRTLRRRSWTRTEKCPTRTPPPRVLRIGARRPSTSLQVAEPIRVSA